MTAVSIPFRALAHAWSPSKNFRSLFEHHQDTFGLINGLRFLSFIWILIFHNFFAYGIVVGKEAMLKLSDESSPATWWVYNADKAVDLFFVISGFLISLILFKEVSRTHTIRLRRFYFRRYLRLTPIYAFLLLIYWLVGARNAEYVWTNFFYVNNFLEVDQMALQWTWSLAVEEQFYLLLPLILLGAAKLPGKPFMAVLTGLLVLSFVIRLLAFYGVPGMWDADFRALLTDPSLYPQYYANIYDNLATRYGPFVCGAMAAHAYSFHQDNLRQWLSAHPRQRQLLSLLAALLIVGFAGLPVFNQLLAAGSLELRTYLVVNRNLFSAGLAWFMLVTFLNIDQGSVLTRFLSLRIWQPFSQLTYSMYLVHMMVIVGVMYNAVGWYKLAPGMDAEMRIAFTLCTGIALSLAITIVIGVICWLLVEKPFLNLRDFAKPAQGATGTQPIAHNLPAD